MILLALVLAQEVEPVPAEPPAPCPWTVALRAGAWRIGDFSAELPAGLREFERSVLMDVGVDVGFSFDGPFVALSGDYAASSQIRATSLALRGGYAGDVGCLFDQPLRVGLSAGVLAGTLDVDESRFGDFEAGIGGVGRVDLTVAPLGLWAELRWIEFEFEPASDEAAGGATAAVGLSLLLRF